MICRETNVGFERCKYMICMETNVEFKRRKYMICRETNMGDCGATFSPRLHCNQDLRPQPPILKSGPHWTMYAAAGEGAKKKQNRKTGFWEIDLGEWK